MSSLPLGQLFAFGFPGTSLDPRAEQLLSNEHLGGVVLFKRNIESLEQVVALNASIVELRPDALICVDQEGGRVARLRGICTDVPTMRSLGELSQTRSDLPFKIGAMMGRELSALGFNLNFAPVMDVDTNPLNPVIGDRAFSKFPEDVANFGAKLIRGMQNAGLAACAKHFPGHGDTDKDSHFALPTLSHDLTRLRDVELVPFLEAIRSDVATIMTAHVMTPSLDKKYPATLSENTIQGLLRNQMKYDGVVISDDLEMKAVADHYALEDMIHLGLNAGVDFFLICEDMELAKSAVACAHRLVDNGHVTQARVQEALARVQKLKELYIGHAAPASVSYAREIVHCAPHLELIASLRPQ